LPHQPHMTASGLVAEKIAEGGRQRAGVADGYEATGFPFKDNFGDGADITTDDGNRLRHRFKEDETEAFPKAGHEHEIERCHDGWRITAPAEKMDAIHNAKRSGFSFKFCPKQAISGDDKMRGWKLRRDAGEGAQPVDDALLLD